MCERARQFAAAVAHAPSADSNKRSQTPAPPSSKMSSPRHPAAADAHELTEDERLRRARALREMGERLDDVIRQFVAAPEEERPARRDWALAEPFHPRTPEQLEQQRRENWALAVPFYPRTPEQLEQQRLDNWAFVDPFYSPQQHSQPQLPADPRLDGLREPFQLSPHFYDTCDRCVFVDEFGRAHYYLVAKYHRRRPQLWMSPHMLTDVRKKMAKKVKITKWCDK